MAKKQPDIPHRIKELLSARRWPEGIPLPKASTYRSRQPWTPEDVEALRTYYLKYGTRYLARLLGRSPEAIKIRASRMDIDGPARRWTKQERVYLTAQYFTLPIETIARDLKRSLISTRHESYRLGLPETPRPWTKKEIAYVRKHYGKMKIDDMAQHLGRTWKAIVARAGLMDLRIRRVKITPAIIATILERSGSESQTVIAAELGISQPRVATIARNNGYRQAEERWWQDHWRPADDLYIREHYSTTSVKDIGRHLGRSAGMISYRIKFLKLPRKQSHRVLSSFWTPQEDKILRKNYRTLSNSNLAAKLGRTRSSVKYRLKNLDLRRIEVPLPTPIPWTPKETAVLRKLYMTHGNRQIAEILGRPISTVMKNLARHGLRRLDGPHAKAPLWRPEEDAQLRELHGKHSIQKIAEIMGRSRTSVGCHLKNLGMTKPRKPSVKR